MRCYAIQNEHCTKLFGEPRIKCIEQLVIGPLPQFREPCFVCGHDFLRYFVLKGHEFILGSVGQVCVGFTF
ncbi:hypothetical protein LMG29542_01384 [Paraburkholderia humisilvae]|uniref:Uncharacterized protein n=1 Tax=Paraburkholderia humisilvae TaxID=627669 RepID=A0A6J5DC10_9BURK|nr:hypothetical protein LMG29542_01384 [Paraburkholderia humisilvae]